MKTLKKSDKKYIEKQLNQQFGISNLPYLLLRFGKEKVRVYSGDFSKEELKFLDKNLKVETIGLYLGKQQRDGFRLSVDGALLLKNQITKNILTLNDKQAEQWLRGIDIPLEKERSFKIIKYKNDILGCGKSTGQKLTNFVPKERRIKN